MTEENVNAAGYEVLATLPGLSLSPQNNGEG